MITDVQIYYLDKSRKANFPEEYNTRDLMVDVVHSLQPGADARHLEMKHGADGRVLNPDLTLEENGVQSRDELYVTLPGEPIRPKEIVCRKCQTPNAVNAKFCSACGTALSERDEDLVFEVTSPQGRREKSRAPQDTTVGAFLANLITFFDLPAVDAAQKPIPYHLVREGTDKALDAKKTLGENGVTAGQHFLMKGPVVVPEDIQFDCSTKDRRSRPCHTPSDLPTAKLVADLVDFFKLPQAGVNNRPNEYELVDSSSQAVLDAKKTLWANGVRHGSRLLIQTKTAETVVEGWFQRHWLWLAAGALGVLILGALVHWLPGWKSGGDGPAAPVTITVTPARQSLRPNETVKFSASVQHAKSDGVRWSVVPGVGSIAADGTYTPPSSVSARQTVEVIAASVDDVSATAKAELTLIPFTANMNPPAASLGPSQSQQFSVSLPGGAATWSLNPNVGTVSQTGLYVAPPTLSAGQTVTVTAADGATPANTASATIALNPSIVLRVLPAGASVDGGSSRQFSVNPAPDGPVQWSIDPQVGSISQNGVYSAPTAVGQVQRVSVIASAGAGNRGVATVQIQPVAVTGITSSDRGGSIQFGASVAHSRNTAVTWSISPQIGSITPSGLYTRDPKETKALDLTVTATSVADTGKWAKTVVHLPAAAPPASTVKISLNPYSKVLVGGQSATFSATITGTADRAVTWSSVGLGTILPFGQYLAPKVIPPGDHVVRIVVTSNADPSKKAEGEFVLRPAPPYSGPTRGTLQWTGSVDDRTMLTFQGTQVSLGTFTGALPGVPVTVRVTTPKVSIVTPPSAANGWRLVSVHTSGKVKSITIEWTATP